MKRLLKPSHFCKVLILLCVLSILIRPSACAFEPIHHELKIDYEPLTSMIRVQDKVSIETTDVHCDSYSFYLHSGMKVEQKETSIGWLFSVENSEAGTPHVQKILIQTNPGENCQE